MSTRHFLSLLDLSSTELNNIIERARVVKETLCIEVTKKTDGGHDHGDAVRESLHSNPSLV